jgi:hypothetical protein
MEYLITLDGTLSALVFLAVLVLILCGIGMVLDEITASTVSPPEPKGETVGERWTQVVTTAPMVLNSDPARTTLGVIHQVVEERADAATLEILQNINETFRRQ